MGIDVGAFQQKKRPECRTCLDWSVRRMHLAGSVGAALLTVMRERNWLTRLSGSRALKMTAYGQQQFDYLFVLPS